MVRSNPSNDLTPALLFIGLIAAGAYALNKVTSALQLQTATTQIANLPSSIPGNPAPGSPDYLQKAIGQ